MPDTFPGRLRTEALMAMLVLIVGSAHCGVAAAQESAADSSRAPNILFYILDDVGIETMPQYPDSDLPKAVTPTMDALAENGIVFDNVWVNPMCGPTRATLVTGQYGVQSGFGGAGSRLGSSHTSLQRFLEDNAPVDYATGAFGKWHVNDNPLDLGVEYYAGLLGNIGRENSYYGEWTFTENGADTQRSDYATTVTTDYAINWIEEQDGGPWFAWVAHQSPHGPFHTPPEGMFTSYAGKEEPTNLENFISMLESVDQELQRILDSLDPDERAVTTIIVLGDNGSPGNVMAGSGVRAKGSVYQGGVHVPMKREDALINGTDMFATIAELAGTGTKTHKNSISQLELFSNDVAGPRKYAYTEDNVGTGNSAGAAGGAAAGMGGAMGMGMGMGMGAGADAGESEPWTWTVRNDRYKLIVAGATEELYDLSVDPREQNNLLAADADNSEVTNAVNELKTVGRQIHVAQDADLRR
jgi:arylsulfatase A-like enzyme